MRDRRRCWLVVITSLAGLGALPFIAVPAMGAADTHGQPTEQVVTNPAPPSPAGRGTPPEDPGRGLVWRGLERGEAGGPCASAYVFTGVGETGPCSHGPDPAPEGVDVRRRRSTTELAQSVSEGSASGAAAPVPCYGDGTSGDRVQAIYAHAADVPGRYTDVVDLIGQWAANVDAVFADSAAETGGIRHVRWVTDANCDLSVLDVQLSNSGDDSWSATANELSSLGLDRTDRKYVVWVDATLYCGIGGFQSDDRAGNNNANNRGPAYARVDTGCWGQSDPVEAHELMHNLGGVQYSAPHSTGGGHCTDDYDRMCYRDGTQVTMSYPCPSTHERLFDCGHDDYFHTSPPAGSYLASHWNAAFCGFLATTEPPPASTTSSSTATTTPPPSTTTTTSSATTSTTSTTTPPPANSSASYSGSLSRKARSRTYDIHAGAGAVNADLSFTQASTLSMRLTRLDGTVVAQGSGPSVLHLTSTITAGDYRLVVESSGANARFNLAVTYPTP